MLHPLNTNSTTFLANAIRTADGNGDRESRDKITFLLQNLLSVKSSAIEKNILEQKNKIPFDIDTTLNALESKNDLFETINHLKFKINFAENRLLKNKSEYVYKFCDLKSEYLDSITQCQRILNRINLGIPLFENKVELTGTNLLPDELNIEVLDSFSGDVMTLNECITSTRDRAKEYEHIYETHEHVLQQELAAIIDKTKQNIAQINSQIESLNAALEQQEKTVNSASFIIDLTHSPQKVIGNLRDLLFYVKKQEKYRANAATALYYSPLAHNLANCAQHGTLDEVIALVKTNQTLTPATQHNRKLIIYELVKQDRENIIQSLYARLGERAISHEFRLDTLHTLSLLKMTAENDTTRALLKERLDEIMSVLYSASNYTPALVTEGQYLSLSKKLAFAYNSRFPNINGLLTQAETLFDINLQSNTVDVSRINMLIRYLIDGKSGKK